MAEKDAFIPLNERDPLDFGVRVGMAILFAGWGGLYLSNAIGFLLNLDSSKLGVREVWQGFSILAVSLFTLTVAALYIVRLPARRTAIGIWPRLAAFLGAFLLMALAGLKPNDTIPLNLQRLAFFLVLVGQMFGVYALLYLGRSFSILPESRRLITSGPYRYVRHPLYLAEAIATVGALITFWSPWALLIVVVQLELQLVRIQYEEKVLSETFPEYADYAHKTSRLIPWLY